MAAGSGDTWMTARQIDGFQVANAHSWTIEKELEGFADWEADPPELAGLRASLLESDNELFRIFVFTASYAEVHELMAPYQHDMPILRGLHREDYTSNLVASAVAAFIAGDTGSTLVGRQHERSQEVAARVSSLLAQVPAGAGRLRLDRCDQATFQSALPSALLSDEDLGLLVQRNALVLVRA